MTFKASVLVKKEGLSNTPVRQQDNIFVKRNITEMVLLSVSITFVDIG